MPENVNLQPIENASPTQSPSELATKPRTEVNTEIKHDLSQITKGEEYVAEIQKRIKVMSTDELMLIVSSATENYVTFEPQQFGFQLPGNLSIYARNGLQELTDLPDALSPRRNFVSMVATELWTRRLVDATNVERHGVMGADRQEVPSRKVIELRQVEEMANNLFNSVTLNRDRFIVDIQSAIALKMPGYERNNLLRSDDLAILQELLFDKGNLTPDQIKHLGANSERITYLIDAIKTTLNSSQYATRLDASIAQYNKPGQVNIDRYGGAYGPIWLENLRKFVQLNKDFGKEVSVAGD